MTSHPPDRPLLAIVLMIAAVTCLSGVDAIGKAALDHLLGLAGTLIVVQPGGGNDPAWGALLAPFQYFQLVSATLAGWLIWSEWPTRHVWVGAAIVVASGLYVIWLEHRRTREA